MSCRLCNGNQLKTLISADNREFGLCLNCKLITVEPKLFLSQTLEKAYYLQHDNRIDDSGYVKFLNRAVTPALPYINKNMRGLDFGCGPSPVLSMILEQRGYRCDNYDPFFLKNDLNKQYDFIFSTEVFEHFRYPRIAIQKIISLLTSNAILIVMTERWTDINRFNTWYYTRDPSHVAFYHDDTFNYICHEFGLQKIYDDSKRIVIFKKMKITKK